MAIRPFTVVEAGQVRPPRGATLLGSVNVITNAEPRWEGGFTWDPEPCGDQQVIAMGTCDVPFAGWTEGGVLAGSYDADFPDYLPMYAAAANKCSAIGGQDALDRATNRARSLLDRCLTKAIAEELWTGAVARGADPDLPNDYLGQQATLTPLSGSVVASLTAMQELEMGLAACSCGGQGVIHASPRVATRWNNQGLVERQPDGRLLTALGTLVVADPGYTGAAPTGLPASGATFEWAFGTGMVDVRLGPVLTTPQSEGVVYSTNDFTAYAYRAFAATFDPCCHVGIRVSLTTLT